MDAIKIIIVDDAKVTRIGLSVLFNQTKEFEIIGEAENGLRLLSLLHIKSPDVILMDVNMPVLDGIETSQQVLAKYPNIKIIALTNSNGEDSVFEMTEAGAKGFLTKDVDFVELRRAVLTVYDNGIYVAPKLVAHLRQSKASAQIKESVLLTAIQRQILELLCEGKALTNIAYLLKKDIELIEQQFLMLLEKTKTTNAVALVLFAIKHKLVENKLN